MPARHSAKRHDEFGDFLNALPAKPQSTFTVKETIAANAAAFQHLRENGYSDEELHVLTCEKLGCELSLETFRTYLRTALKSSTSPKRHATAKPKRTPEPVEPETPDEDLRTEPAPAAETLPDETSDTDAPEAGSVSEHVSSSATDPTSLASRTNDSEAIEKGAEDDAE